MTDEERLAKNRRIAKTKQETKHKRKSQVCCAYRIKIDLSHLNKAQILRLQMIFVEAKWLYNDAISFMNDHDVNEYDPQKLTVQGLDKDRNQVTHKLQYLTSQMRIAVVDGIKNSLKSLSSKKKRHRKTGKLRYKSDYASINLKQYGITYRFYDSQHIELQGFKKRKRIKVRGANQFWNIAGIEFANAKLLSLPDGYYLDITTYQNKGGEHREYKPEIGIDMGIKTTITTSEGKKYKVLIEESERLKKCQRLIARRKKGSSNRYKARKLLRKAYQRLSKKKNTCGTQETFNPAFGEDIQRTQACKTQAEHRGATSLN